MNEFTQSLSFRQSSLVVFVAGILNVFSFAPLSIWPIQIVSLALLFALLIQNPHWTKKQIGFIGFAYSFGFLFAGISWLIIAMSRYGGLPVPLSVIGLMFFVLYLTLYPVLSLLVATSLKKRWQFNSAKSLLLIFPTCWMLGELLRGYVMTGFPWLVSGYAHSANYLIGFAPLIGVYGLSLLSAVVAGFFALVIIQKNMMLNAALSVTTIFAIGFGLHQVNWTQENGQPMTVRLLQGNIDQNMKFNESFLFQTLDQYEAMVTEKAADLIVTPETALPILHTQLPEDYFQRLSKFSTETKSYLMFGVVMDDGNRRYANSAIGFAPNNDQHNYRYDKHHLVPFGEFIPYGFKWFINLLTIPMGEYADKGILQAPMKIKDQWVMPNICYEDLFGDEIAKQIHAQSKSNEGVASILLNISNLAWYGDSFAIPQHLQISQMRSVETGRPMLRSTNTGATAMINSKGQVEAELKPLTQASLEVTVQGMKGLTPYIRFGDGGVLLLSGLVMIAAYLRRK